MPITSVTRPSACVISTGDELVDLFVQAVSPRTRLVSFTHISNITGLRLPAQEMEVLGGRRRVAELEVVLSGEDQERVHDPPFTISSG